MKKLTLLFFFVASCSLSVYAQHASINGIIRDTINKENLGNTVISLLRAKDSVLANFTRSKADGSFTINQIDSGKYVLLVTYPRFADYLDNIYLTDTSQIHLGNIQMTLLANLLQEVVVRQQIAAIRIKGDTLEFKADSFKVREGAAVEDMLKKLPGIQVDKDGKITAQGEKVEKVLVDGEEFFGDDPTIATKNIQADAIDKVQVFDKKSYQATFTGIDDGVKKKTINLTLKEDKKKGYFGKIDLGGGLHDRWNNSAMFNRFRAKKKISAYGIMSSTGKTGLDWQENNQYGSGDGNMEFSDDMIFINNANQDELSSGSYYGQGLPKSWAGGLQFSNKFDADKQNINGSYRFNKLTSEGAGSTISQSILPDTVFFNTEKSNTYSSRLRHSINGIYDWQLDSSSSIKVTASGYTGKQESISNYTSEAINGKTNKVNSSSRTNSANGDNQNLKTTWLFRKKFAKQGRTFSFNIDQKYAKNKTDGYLNALNIFYGSGGTISSEKITDQRKLNLSETSLINSKMTYTEPIAKKLFAEINYAFRVSNSNAEKLSYDKDNSGKYGLLNDTFSNNYKFNVLTNTAGLALKFNGKKITASMGSDVAFSHFSQTDLLKDSVAKRNYTNLFPKGSFTYKINQSSRVNINYNGSTHQPTIQQIQPVADNSNPLIITVGNPLLKQEFRHMLSANFNTYQVLKQRGVFMYSSVTFTKNAIVTSNYTDSSNRTIYQYINTNGNYNAYGGLYYNMKLTKLDMFVNAGLNYNSSRYNSFVNNRTNTTDNAAPGINIGFGKNKEKKYDLYYSYNLSYNMSKSSIRPDLKTNFWIQTHSLNATVTLPFKMEFHNEVEATIRQKTALFSGNNNLVIWNAYLGHKILKNDKAIIKISANDILNQNRGYNRTINSTVLQEQNYQTINRYFLLSFVWNFSKNPGQ